MQFFQWLMLYLLRMIDPIEETSEGLHNAFSTSGKHLSYMAAIINNDANFICNGVLVSDRFVLTAAKCIYPHMLNPYSHLTVITGTHLYDIEQNNVNNQTFTKSEILKVYLTAKWSKNLDKRNHIVLIKLAAPIPITEKQKPISLPEKPPPDNVYGLVTGWGTFGENYTTSSSLNYLHVKFSHKFCKDTSSFKTQTYHLCSNRMWSDSEYHCAGSNGSPLVYNKTLIALAISDTPCIKGGRDIFTSVYHFKYILYEELEVTNTEG